jgi:hypothetical protein
MGEAARKLDPEEEASKPKLRLAEDNEPETKISTQQETYTPPDLKLLDEDDNTGETFDNGVSGSGANIRDEEIFGKTKEESKQDSNSPSQQQEDSISANKSSGPVVDNFNQNKPISDNQKPTNSTPTPITDQNKSDFQPGGGPALTANPGKKDVTAPPKDDFAKSKSGLDDSRTASKAKMAKIGTQAAGKLAQGDIGGAADMAEQVGTKIAANAAGKAAAAALVASGVGSFAAGIADKAVKYATEKLMPLVKKYALPIIGLNTLVLLLIIGSLIGIIGAAMRGGLGRGAGVAASAFNSEDINNANIILGSQQSLINYKGFYLNQGHKDWGNEKRPAAANKAKDNWGENQTYSGAGCALTSAAMISKYYGMTNVTPKIIGDYMAEYTHCMYRDFGAWM